MELKDVIHFYIGCEVQWKHDTKSKFWLVGYDVETVRLKTQNGASIFPIKTEDITIFIRPLSDMTEEEQNAYWFLNSVRDSKEQCEATNTRYLLSKHFDLFGLIESGQAINKTTL